MTNIMNNNLIVLLGIIFIGYLLGRIRIFGVSLGSSSCLFVALAAGAMGADIPQIITSVGIIFFVYSIGLQAGPSFFHLFNRRGIKYSILAVVTALVAAGVTFMVAYLLHIDTASAVGAFAGAMTSTPTLAAAIDALKNVGGTSEFSTSLSYALTYPFGLISVVLFVQIISRLYSGRIKEERRREDEKKMAVGLQIRKYRLLNSNIAGKTIKELHLHQICKVNITRFKRDDKVYLCTTDTVFKLGDIVVAVGSPAEFEKFKMLFGEEADSEFGSGGEIEIRDIFVSGSQVVGKTLSELKISFQYGVTITRVRRGDVDIAPTGELVLEVGDFIRVAGSKESVERFLAVAGSEKRKLDETNILILTMGMFLGALIGEVPLRLGVVSFKLGVAGGPLFVALLISHFGRIGKWSIRVPSATKFFLRDLGLVFFLIGIGVKTGQELATAANQYNIIMMMLLGASITTITISFVFIIAVKFFKLPIAASLGVVCGAKTSTPSLGILIKELEDESPAISYAAVYPVAIIVLTIVGQLFVIIGKNILK